MVKKALKEEKETRDIFSQIREELIGIKEEIRADVVGPVVASFGFIIALIWRDAIRATLDEFLSRAGLLEKVYIYEIVSAIIVTVCVIVLMISVTKFGRAKKEQKVIKQVKKEIEKLDELEQEVTKKLKNK